MVDLPAPERPVNQRTKAFWSFCAARARPVDPDRLPMDVLRPAQREMDDAGGNRLVGKSGRSG